MSLACLCKPLFIGKAPETHFWPAWGMRCYWEVRRWRRFGRLPGSCPVRSVCVRRIQFMCAGCWCRNEPHYSCRVPSHSSCMLSDRDKISLCAVARYECAHVMVYISDWIPPDARKSLRTPRYTVSACDTVGRCITTPRQVRITSFEFQDSPRLVTLYPGSRKPLTTVPSMCVLSV